MVDLKRPKADGASFFRSFCMLETSLHKVELIKELLHFIRLLTNSWGNEASPASPEAPGGRRVKQQKAEGP